MAWLTAAVGDDDDGTSVDKRTDAWFLGGLRRLVSGNARRKRRICGEIKALSAIMSHLHYSVSQLLTPLLAYTYDAAINSMTRDSRIATWPMKPPHSILQPVGDQCSANFMVRRVRFEPSDRVQAPVADSLTPRR